jgi:PPM family protein phosphatase
MIRLIGGHATDAGRVRSNNQDRIVAVDGRLYGVADGMGGHRGGEVAAEVVASGLANIPEATATESALTTETVTNEIVALNELILDRANADEDLFGMGTTLTAIALANTTTPNGTEQVVSVFNVGDSRTYLLRNGELQQLTDDHSVVADLIRAGKITAEEAKTHRQRSVVTRALGVDTIVEIDVLEVLPSPGMRYLMCSDGLTNEVPDEMIGSILRRLANPAEAARELVRMAVERGGRDNVTVVVVDVIDDTDTDHLALLASREFSSSADATQPIGAHTTTAVNVAASAQPIVPPANAEATAKAKTDSNTGKPVIQPIAPTNRARKPLPINIRVIAFFVALAALAGVVFAVVKSAPGVVEPEKNVPIASTETTIDPLSTTTTTTTTNDPNVAPTVAPAATTTIVGAAATAATTVEGSTTNATTSGTADTSIPGTAGGPLESTTKAIDDYAPDKPTKATKAKTGKRKVTKAKVRKRTTK